MLWNKSLTVEMWKSILWCWCSFLLTHSLSVDLDSWMIACNINFHRSTTVMYRKVNMLSVTYNMFLLFQFCERWFWLIQLLSSNKALTDSLFKQLYIISSVVAALLYWLTINCSTANNKLVNMKWILVHSRKKLWDVGFICALRAFHSIFDF